MILKVKNDEMNLINLLLLSNTNDQSLRLPLNKRTIAMSTGAKIIKRARVMLGVVIFGTIALPYLTKAAPKTEPTPNFTTYFKSSCIHKTCILEPHCPTW